jgi:hypothetical protein
MVTLDSNREEIKVFARLPGLDIAAAYRGSRDGDGEQLAVTVRAVPLSEAAGRHFKAVNPFLLWMGLTHLAWTAWLRSLSALSTPSPAGREELGCGTRSSVPQHADSSRPHRRPHP